MGAAQLWVLWSSAAFRRQVPFYKPLVAAHCAHCLHAVIVRKLVGVAYHQVLVYDLSLEAHRYKQTQAFARSIDLRAQKVLCADFYDTDALFDVNYDYLVLAQGSLLGRALA
jgi:NADH dehydrogenase FAD-containing subunit